MIYRILKKAIPYDSSENASFGAKNHNLSDPIGQRNSKTEGTELYKSNWMFLRVFVANLKSDNCYDIPFCNWRLSNLDYLELVDVK